MGGSASLLAFFKLSSICMRVNASVKGLAQQSMLLNSLPPSDLHCPEFPFLHMQSQGSMLMHAR